MSRVADANLFADQVLYVARFVGFDAGSAEAIIHAFDRCTYGLTDYERNQVAGVVNFRLARAVL